MHLWRISRQKWIALALVLFFNLSIRGFVPFAEAPLVWLSPGQVSISSDCVRLSNIYDRPGGIILQRLWALHLLSPLQSYWRDCSVHGLLPSVSSFCSLLSYSESSSTTSPPSNGQNSASMYSYRWVWPISPSYLTHITGPGVCLERTRNHTQCLGVSVQLGDLRVSSPCPYSLSGRDKDGEEGSAFSLLLLSF